MNTNKNQKAMYVEPSLQRLGSISSLTAGGSSGQPEGTGGGNGGGNGNGNGGNGNGGNGNQFGRRS